MFTASARTPVRSLGMGDDGERRASSPFLSSSRSLLRPAGNRCHRELGPPLIFGPEDPLP